MSFQSAKRKTSLDPPVIPLSRARVQTAVEVEAELAERPRKSSPERPVAETEADRAPARSRSCGYLLAHSGRQCHNGECHPRNDDKGGGGGWEEMEAGRKENGREIGGGVDEVAPPSGRRRVHRPPLIPPFPPFPIHLHSPSPIPSSPRAAVHANHRHVRRCPSPVLALCHACRHVRRGPLTDQEREIEEDGYDM